MLIRLPPLMPLRYADAATHADATALLPLLRCYSQMLSAMLMPPLFAAATPAWLI